MAAMEAAAAGINWTFAPMIDVTRDPRWGRIAESLGEDPCLASEDPASFLEKLGLSGELARRNPHDLSSGQKRRLALGMARHEDEVDVRVLGDQDFHIVHIPLRIVPVDAEG